MKPYSRSFIISYLERVGDVEIRALQQNTPDVRLEKEYRETLANFIRKYRTEYFINFINFMINEFITGCAASVQAVSVMQIGVRVLISPALA